MVATKEEVLVKPAKGLKEIEDVIAKAIKKLGVKKENELCKYLPMKSGGYMHHFTLKKMKQKQPQELVGFIERFVLGVDRPIVIAPKQRAARGSRKRKDHMSFTRVQLERMLSIARIAGDKEMITILSPRRSLASCKRELIQSIRQSRVDQELWANYVEASQAQHAFAEMHSAATTQN